MTTSKPLSVIIVTYKNPLSQLIPILKAFLPWSIYIEDNSPTNNLRSQLKSYHINYHHNPINIGYGSAINRAVQKIETAYFLILNPDVKPIQKPNVIKNRFYKLISQLEHQPKIALVGFKLLNSNHSIQYSLGNFPTAFNLISLYLKLPFTHTKSYLIRYPNVYNIPHLHKGWLSGAALLVKTSTFKENGGFDKKIFMYGEEVDLAYRLAQKKYSFFYTPTLSFIHYDEGRLATKKPYKNYNLRFSYLYFFAKHKFYFDFYMIKLFLIIEILIKLLPKLLLSAFFHKKINPNKKLIIKTVKLIFLPLDKLNYWKPTP